MIEIHEVIDVSAPLSVAWKVLGDPHAVANCVGGAELGEEHDDGSYDAMITTKFGPLRVKFNFTISFELKEETHEGSLSAQGKEKQGGTRVKASANFAFVDQPESGHCTMTMTGEIQLAGKLAPLIEGGAKTVIRRMTEEFTENFSKACAAVS